MPSITNDAGPVRPRVTASLCLALLTIVALLAACPKVHREPTLPEPPPGCEQGRTLCHAGAPWVCGPGGHWSVADRRCDPLGARCCLAESPFGGMRHACVPAGACVDDDGAPLDAGPPDVDAAVEGGAR